MRRLEVIELRNSVSVNQVCPTSLAGCTYCQAIIHVLEECLVFMTHQMLSEHTNATFSRPTNNLYSQTYNPSWRNHPISYGPKTTMIILGPISPKISIHVIINPIFPIRLCDHPSKIPLLI